MINLTDSALNAVRNAISTANKPVDGLRIMVEAGGCAGYKYMLGLVDEVDPDDTVIETVCASSSTTRATNISRARRSTS